MSEQRDAAADLEQRYVDEHAETDELLEGLDPSDTDTDATERVEAVGDDVHANASENVEAMTRDDS